jgi:hypothetical protein
MGSWTSRTSLAPAIPCLEGEKHNGRWHCARQRVDYEKELVPGLRGRQRGHRSERLRASLGGEDASHQPGHEVVAVVGGHVPDVGDL